VGKQNEQTKDSVALKEGTTVAWRGQNSWASPPDWKILLYGFHWRNPQPDVEIATIDFNSAMTMAAPFLVAITAEP